MKFSEQLMEALGEIDEDLIPDITEEKPRRRRALVRRIAAWAAVFVLAVAVFGAVRMLPETARQTEETAETGGREAFVRHNPGLFYFSPVEAADVRISASFYPLTFGDEGNDSPQICTAEAGALPDFPDLLLFTDRTGRQFEVVTAYIGEETGTARRQLELDLIFVNYTRSYGCVLREIDWYANPAQMRYLGVCPILPEEDVRSRLSDGEYLTSVPEELAPEEFGEDRIARVELVYLINPDERLVQMYYCFFVRLDSYSSAEDGKTRYGLFYVSAVDEENAARILKESKYDE